MISRLKFDIDTQIDVILSRIPTYIWESETTTFCDIQMAGGQFIRKVIQKLRSHGHSDENIKSRVFGFSENQMYLIYVMVHDDIIGTFKLYSKENIKDMKFDVVLGNPPYSSNSKEPVRLWAHFIELGFDLVYDDGIVAMITPSSWMSSTNSVYNLLKNKISYINVSDVVSDAFGTTGGSQKFCCFIAHKNKNDDTCLMTFNEKVDVNMNAMMTPYAPIKSSSYFMYEVVDKLYNSKFPIHDWIRYDTQNIDSGVVIPMAKSMLYDIEYQNVDKFEISRYKLKIDKTSGENISNNLNKKIYRILRWVLRSGPALAGNFKLLPIPIDEITDDELYKQLNLSEDCVTYIESYFDDKN
jgi:hypothetical protein